jgi:hypothetical protein
VLIAVVGSSGLNRIEGIASDHPAALLQVDAAASAGHVVLLAPWYAESIAREQAHVLIAAYPRTVVAVLTPRHHPLTLTLIGAAALQTAGRDADPGAVVALVNAGIARSRSLVWYPRVWGLKEPSPTGGQLLASTFRSPGFFREIATEPALVPAKAGSPVAPTEEVYVAGTSPTLLHRHLGGATVRLTPVELEPHQPYATKSAVPLTVLAGVGRTPGGEPACPSCGARRVGGACLFCGHAAVPAEAPRPVLQLVDNGVEGQG